MNYNGIKSDIFKNISLLSYSEQNKYLAETLEFSQMQIQELSKQLRDAKIELLKYKLKVIRHECNQNSQLDFLNDNAKKMVEMEFTTINECICRLEHLLLQSHESENTSSSHDNSLSGMLSRKNSFNSSLDRMKNIVSNMTIADIGINPCQNITNSSNANNNHDYSLCESVEEIIIEDDSQPEVEKHFENINKTFDLPTNSPYCNVENEPKYVCNEFSTEDQPIMLNDISEKENNTSFQSKTSESQTPEIPSQSTRPRRNAAGKIPTYREPSMKTKLRRGDVSAPDFYPNHNDPNFIFKKKVKKTRGRHSSTHSKKKFEL